MIVHVIWAVIALAVGSQLPADRKPSQAKEIYSCDLIKKYVAIWGEEAVVAKAREAGVSESRIAALRRRCLEEK